jgi:nitrite reductase/ring-hydroxylating ferredoxin subunit
MKKIIVALLFIAITLGCESGRINNNNPFLPVFPVDLSINLNLPQYSNLQFASNFVVDYSQGVRGIVIFNTGSGFTAFDIACPNQDLSTCSTMIFSGINGTCPCDDAIYSLFNGISAGKQYPMRQYRTQVSGNTIVVFN